MKRFTITVTKPINYHMSFEGEDFEQIKQQVEAILQSANVGVNSFANLRIRSYATTAGDTTITLNSEEDLEPKQYKCRIYRVLTKDVILDARREEQAIDAAIEIANDMEDADFEDFTNDAEVLETIYGEKETTNG